VPLIVSQPVTSLDQGGQLHNYDIFNLALNHVGH
jgi:hypothetical protein